MKIDWYFPLISMSDIVSINNLTLILKNISQYDVTLSCLIPIKTITSVLKVSSIIAHPIELAQILAITSVLKVSSITAHPIRLTQILAITSVSPSKLMLFYIIFFRQEWMELKDHVLIKVSVTTNETLSLKMKLKLNYSALYKKLYH